MLFINLSQKKKVKTEQYNFAIFSCGKYFLSKHILTNLLSPWSRDLFEKLIGSQLIKKCPASQFLKTYLNIIFPFTPVSSKRSHFLSFPTKTLYTPLFSPIYAPCYSHLIPLDLFTRTVLGVEYRSLSSAY